MQSAPMRLGLAVLGSLLLAAPSASADDDFELLWSATLRGDLDVLGPEEASDDVTGFFDRYEFTPNKSSAVPFQVGLGDLSLDWLGAGETPRIQLRFESPTSNLGVSGSQIGEPFLDQRADLLGRFGGARFDVDYRRLRTEKLRHFPNPASPGPAHSDLTSPGDRFSFDRTGVGAEVRLRTGDLLGGTPEGLSRNVPQLTLRGGHQARRGRRQLRFLLHPSNDLISLSQRLDQDVSHVGGGVVIAPAGLFTMAIDLDHERFRNRSPTTAQSDLGAAFPASSKTIGFIPETDRTTGSVRLHRRIGRRADLGAGFQASWLEQVGRVTPAQRAAGQRENDLLFYSANFAADVALLERVSANAFFKYDQRDNGVHRDTSLLGPDNASRIDEFMSRWRRIAAGVEAVYRPHRTNRLALGGRLERVDRELDFAAPGGPRILPPNALVTSETRTYTVYGRANLRPFAGARVRGEVGYRSAPQTGYLVDLDDYVYGKLRASYALPLQRAVVLTAFGQGGSGHNRSFAMVGGRGPEPAGARLDRSFERSDYRWGLSLTASPRSGLTLFGSFFHSRDVQDYGLALSDLQRYYQDLASLRFWAAGPIEYVGRGLSLVAGGHARLADRTQASFAYSLSRSEARYRSSAPSAQIQLVQQSSIVDSDVHGLDLELSHQLRSGLRLLLGYGIQIHDDRAPLPAGTGSVVRPFDLSTVRHRVRLGVRIGSDLPKDPGD